MAGSKVNRTVAGAAAVTRNADPALLNESGGEIDVSKAWAKALLVRMNFVCRKGKALKSARHLPTDFLNIEQRFSEELRHLFKSIKFLVNC